MGEPRVGVIQGLPGEEQNMGKASAIWLLPDYPPAAITRMIKETGEALIMEGD